MNAIQSVNEGVKRSSLGLRHVSLQMMLVMELHFWMDEFLCDRMTLGMLSTEIHLSSNHAKPSVSMAIRLLLHLRSVPMEVVQRAMSAIHLFHLFSYRLHAI
jgi:hypothetical protein